jgi:hypothetical protein
MPTIFTRMFRDYEAKKPTTTPAKPPPYQQPILPPPMYTLPADTKEDLWQFHFEFADNIRQNLNSTQPTLPMKPARKLNLWNPKQAFRKWKSKQVKPQLTTCDEAPLQQRVQQT